MWGYHQERERERADDKSSMIIMRVRDVRETKREREKNKIKKRQRKHHCVIIIIIIIIVVVVVVVIIIIIIMCGKSMMMMMMMMMMMTGILSLCLPTLSFAISFPAFPPVSTLGSRPTEYFATIPPAGCTPTLVLLLL
jgi:uncharacterized membrane protein